MIHKTFYYMLFIFFSLIGESFAQNSSTVRGELFDENNKPVAHASIQLGVQQTSSSKEGKFVFQNIASGQHILTINALGYQTYQDTITKKEHEALSFRLILIKKQTELKEVVVQGKTENQVIEQQAIRAI